MNDSTVYDCVEFEVNEGLNMIKFNAINQQHAEIAALQLRNVGVKAVSVGRAVVADYDWSNEVIKIMTEAMGYSLEEITEFDLKELERCQN